MTVSHKLRAIELLVEQQATAAPEPAFVLAEWVSSLSPAELQRELGYYVEPLIQEQVAARLRAGGHERLLERERELDDREAALGARERRVEQAEQELEKRLQEEVQAPHSETDTDIGTGVELGDGPPPGIDPSAGWPSR